jgi:hypothetical protein
MGKQEITNYYEKQKEDAFSVSYRERRIQDVN